jgi:thymidylate synthase (FAD)
MNLKHQKAIIWGQTPSSKEDAILWIEKAGRVCYKSEDKIVNGSGLKFVSNIWKRGHYSVLEHSNIVLRTKEKSRFPSSVLIKEKSVFDSKYFTFCIEHDRVYIAGNWRAWIEFYSDHKEEINLDNFYEFLNDNTSYEMVTDNIPKDLRAYTVHFLTDRAVTHELVRHRPCSFSQQSQRYVRYGDIDFIYPSWYEQTYEKDGAISAFEDHCLYTEEIYNHLLDNKMKAEDARVVLSNAVATEIVVTANIREWQHIFNLRIHKAAYPQIKKLLAPVKQQFKENGWMV